MKKLFFAVIFISSYGYSQNNFLYGIYLGYDPYAQRGLAGNSVYDANTAEWTIINVWSDSDIHAFGDHTLDPENMRWYQVYGDSLNMYLLMIDMVTGDTLQHLFTVDSVGDGTAGTVTIGGNINGTFYNCTDDCVYFTHYKAPYEDSVHLAKVNVNDYTVTEVAAFHISYYAIDNMVFTSNQEVYMLYYDYYANISKVLTYSLQSNLLSSADFSVPGFNANELLLTFNNTDGKLYGIQYDLDSFAYNYYLGTLRGVRLDPVSGQLDFLTPDYYANIIGSNTSLHSLSSGDKVYFEVQLSNPSYYESLGIFDINTGTIAFDTITYTNALFGTPTPFGIDLFNLSKGCYVATEVSNPADADCNFSLAPDVSSDRLMIHADCDLSAYQSLKLQVFDILGRKVFDGAIHESDGAVKMKLASSVVYVYRLLDGTHLIHSGKFVAVQ